LRPRTNEAELSGRGGTATPDRCGRARRRRPDGAAHEATTGRPRVMTVMPDTSRRGGCGPEGPRSAACAGESAEGTTGGQSWKHDLPDGRSAARRHRRAAASGAHGGLAEKGSLPNQPESGEPAGSAAESLEERRLTPRPGGPHGASPLGPNRFRPTRFRSPGLCRCA
jgi:hypothetical protein